MRGKEITLINATGIVFEKKNVRAPWIKITFAVICVRIMLTERNCFFTSLGSCILKILGSYKAQKRYFLVFVYVYVRFSVSMSVSVSLSMSCPCSCPVWVYVLSVCVHVLVLVNVRACVPDTWTCTWACTYTCKKTFNINMNMFMNVYMNMYMSMYMSIKI